MTKKREATVTEAAEYLWAIFDEFKAKNETAQLAMRRARVLLEVTTNEALKAVEANAKANARDGSGYQG
jgi:hypothetical protein